MYLGAEVFSPQLDREAAKAVFAKSVERVEVETHSYCNRRCNYCPNVVGDRLGENKQMRPEHWQMVLRDLAEIGFSKHLVFTSYNEPLADAAMGGSVVRGSIGPAQGTLDGVYQWRLS